MCSAAAYSSFLILPTKTPSFLRRINVTIFNSPSPFRCYLRPTVHRQHLFASIAERNVELSWFSPDHNQSDDFGGWAIVDCPVLLKKKRGFSGYVIGVGTSIVVLAAVIAHFSLSRKGFKLHFGSPLQLLHGILNPNATEGDQSKTVESADTSNGNTMVPEARQEGIPDAVTETSASVHKPELVIIPVAVDSTQQEALSVLMKLKIIEDDVNAGELCTRREYARWLVRMSSLLERNLKNRVIPTIALSGSVITAFDDVSIEDPDFGFIQALAEAGIVHSKLSLGSNWSSNYLDSEGNAKFFPDRFISRQDIIDWKAQLEYELTLGIIDQLLKPDLSAVQISSKKLGFMDGKEISPQASLALYMDMLAGNKSILRKVFGQTKRFQPNKPSTKAQTAVALTSGRMTEAISSELSRIEAESSARQAEAECIRSELLERGYIQRFWEEKFDEEKIRGCDVEKLYHDAISDLEQAKLAQHKIFAEYLNEKAAMDCQRQLLFSLKEEVHEMSAKLASERVTYVDEKQNLKHLLSDLENKQEEMLNTKSTLEAEKEALQILRSWVEDEARKSLARAKVLEEVGRRWKWDNQA
ncbi:S-layer domain containing protein [Quillaja saponaria]|uniref:S-layer domain containing protein n=1 Tax=Quillaja saponaria TaxID=32244 RepID=A0AAD7KP91_QUISA|nr:S-layer domain containing protein [Quillaja saponaria]